MKKLTKQNLDELAATMNLVPADEQREFIGMYSNDCFWRCVAYMRENDGSEAMAEIYAQSYYKRFYGDGTDAYLRQYGSGATYGDINGFIKQSMSDGSYSPSDVPHSAGYIGFFNNSSITDYKNGPAGHHAVIINPTPNSDGSYNYYDPQGNVSGTISASEIGNVSRVMY